MLRIRPLLRSHLTWLVLVVLLALAVRLTWALVIRVEVRDEWRFDMTIYDFQAQMLAAGAGHIHYDGFPTAHWPPGYPAALTPLYYLFDDNPFTASLLNAAVGAVTALLIYLLGARLFGRGIGLTGAFVFALFPNQIFFTSLILSEVLFAGLFVLALLLTAWLLLGERPPQPWQAGLVGLLIGIATLVRGEALLLAAIIIPVLLLRWRSRRQVALLSSALIAGTIVVVAPWTLRNYSRMGDFILISTSSTEAFWMGHHEGADGRIGDFEPGIRNAGLINPERERRTNEQALEEAVSYIRDHPLDDLKLIPSKLYYLYKDDGSSMHWYQIDKPTLPEGTATFLSGLASVYYWGALVVAAVGLRAWFSLRDPGRALLVGAAIYWTVMFGVFFFGDNRFHFALIPILSLWAAASIVAFGSRMLSRPAT